MVSYRLNVVAKKTRENLLEGTFPYNLTESLSLAFKGENIYISINTWVRGPNQQNNTMVEWSSTFGCHLARQRFRIWGIWMRTTRISPVPPPSPTIVDGAITHGRHKIGEELLRSLSDGPTGPRAVEMAMRQS